MKDDNVCGTNNSNDTVKMMLFDTGFQMILDIVIITIVFEKLNWLGKRNKMSLVYMQAINFKHSSSLL